MILPRSQFNAVFLSQNYAYFDEETGCMGEYAERLFMVIVKTGK